MDNLWLLTEERPKPSVVHQIVDMYCKDFGDRITVHNEIKIKPIIVDGVFKFVYKVEGLAVAGAADIFIKTVSGSSSFLDFLFFKQENAPTAGSSEDNLIMAIEETKTSDDESRNTGVYQRGAKFVYIPPYYQNVKLYMLYNEELGTREEKKPSDTSVFGTNILLTLGVTIAITKYADRIEISGRLAKPADAGNIGHDPNIGALSMIAACIRRLGWDKNIVVTLHGATQSYVDHTRGKISSYISAVFLAYVLMGSECRAMLFCRSFIGIMRRNLKKWRIFFFMCRRCITACIVSMKTMPAANVAISELRPVLLLPCPKRTVMEKIYTCQMWFSTIRIQISFFLLRAKSFLHFSLVLRK